MEESGWLGPRERRIDVGEWQELWHPITWDAGDLSDLFDVSADRTRSACTCSTSRRASGRQDG